ncbi:MAG: hypothetical protein ACKVW3_13740 [Phycisphaerales bacterium]
MRKSFVLTSVVGVAVAASGAAAQQSIFSFGFTELNGAYDQGLMRFTADGVNAGVLQSTGDVTRLQNPGSGTALYDPGFANGLVNVTLTVSGILGTTANGAGFITITDADGDTITGAVNGQFIANGPAVFFNGLLSNVNLNDNGPLDGLFNGPSGGAFPLSFLPNPPPYTGAIVQLYIGSPGNFFTSTFSGVSTQVSGGVVPAPAGLALLGLAAGAARRRRR